MGRSAHGATTTEVVLVMPAVLFLIMIVIQFALWYHAQSVAVSAAQDGARIARLEGATADQGAEQSRVFLRSAAGRVLEDTAVSARRDDTTARIEVRGHVVGVIPGFHLPVNGVGESPVERFRPHGAR